MKYWFLIFLILLTCKFFGAITVNNTVLLAIVFAFLIANIKNGTIYKYSFIALAIGLIINILSCNIYNKQSFFDTFKASAPYLYILFYFVLRGFNPSVAKTEKIVIHITVLFCFCYILQFLLYPTVIFSGALQENLNNDNLRIRLIGQGFTSLGYFFGLNKYLTQGKKKSLLLSLLCFIVIFLMGFRTMLFMLMLFSVITWIKVKGFNWLLVGQSIAATFFLILLMQIPVFATKFEGMQKRQESDVFSNSEYIRVIQFNYYLNEHFQDKWHYIMGSGEPNPVSQYGKKMENLFEMNIFWMDWGLVGLSWIIGIISVLAMIMYSYKVVMLKVPLQYIYLGIWFLYLVFSSITTAEFFRPGNFVVQAIVLYLAEKINSIYNTRNSKYESRHLHISQSH